MQYLDLLLFSFLATLTVMPIELSRRAGTFLQQGRQERATAFIAIAGVGQVMAVFLALHLGFRASLV